MEAKELRLGNHVNFFVSNGVKNVLGEKGIITRISDTWIYINGIRFYKDDLRPITLTEEILLKCGFICMHDGNYWDKNLCVHYGKEGFYVLTEQKRIYLKFLHKLQNFYIDVTDEELEINL